MTTSDDPIAAFQALRERARTQEPLDGTAAVLATVDGEGQPSARVVLLKGVDQDGFQLFTNYESRKARELAANPRAALVFWWPTLETQVRIEGRVERLTRKENEAYFATRPRESQLGAWASRQSERLPSREELEARFEQESQRFAGQDVPCPAGWGGYCLAPERIEFWESRAHRLHHRVAFTRAGNRWTAELLYP